MSIPCKVNGQPDEVVDLDLPGDLVRLRSGRDVNHRVVEHPRWDPWLGLTAMKTSQRVLGTNDLSDGVMVALLPPDEVMDQVALLAGDDSQRDNMHVTAVYLGKMSEVDLKALRSAVVAFATDAKPLRGQLSGWGIFNHPDGKKILHTKVIIREVDAWRDRLLLHLNREGLIDRSSYSFAPHMTVGYYDHDISIPSDPVPGQPFTFEAIIMSFGDIWESYPLQGLPPATASQDDPFLFEGMDTPPPPPGVALVSPEEEPVGDPLNDPLLAMRERAVQAQRQHKTAARVFTADEQKEIINEGEGVTAANLDLLDIAGTHYEAFMGPIDDDDPTWLI